MACTHPYWSALQVGSQHLARQFAKNGWQVHYISAPVTPLHLPVFLNSGNELVRRFRCALKGPTLHAEGTIHSYIPFSLMAPAGHPLLRQEAVTHHWHQTMIPALSSLKKRLPPQGIDLLYLDNLSYHFLLDQFSCGKSMFRVMDVHEGFPGWEGKARNLAVKIAGKADLTVYSALGLENYVDGLNPRKSAFVPNGVDCGLFRKTGKGQHRHPLLQHIPDPFVLYTGMIDARVNFRAIRFAARSLPQVSFVFAGPVGTGMSNSINDLPSNVHFIGPLPHQQLPGLMQFAAAGMIPFDVESQMDLIQGIRPLKLFEYMAAGLSVISAKWPELEKLDSPAWLYGNKEQFAKLVHNALDRDYDQNSKSYEFAVRYDWKRIFNTLISALSEE